MDTITKFTLLGDTTPEIQGVFQGVITWIDKQLTKLFSLHGDDADERMRTWFDYLEDVDKSPTGFFIQQMEAFIVSFQETFPGYSLSRVILTNGNIDIIPFPGAWRIEDARIDNTDGVKELQLSVRSIVAIFMQNESVPSQFFMDFDFRFLSIPTESAQILGLDGKEDSDVWRNIRTLAGRACCIVDTNTLKLL